MSEVVALTYDTLPAPSNLRREIDDDGNVRIALAPGEPGLLARRAALYSTAWISVTWSVLITLLLGAFVAPMFFANLPRTRAYTILLLMSAGVFFSAMFLLVWWLEYRKRLDDIERAAMQMTVVVASPRRLFIESVGPFGKFSKDLAPPGYLHCKRMPGSRIECLQIETLQGETTFLFPGLSARELRWIAGEIHRAASPA